MHTPLVSQYSSSACPRLPGTVFLSGCVMHTTRGSAESAVFRRASLRIRHTCGQLGRHLGGHDYNTHTYTHDFYILLPLASKPQPSNRNLCTISCKTGVNSPPPPHSQTAWKHQPQCIYSHLQKPPPPLPPTPLSLPTTCPETASYACQLCAL